MPLTYRVLSQMLCYPSEGMATTLAEYMRAVHGERLISPRARIRLARLAARLAQGDLYEAQARYVDLFDRSRSLSLQLYEHIHGESRDRGQAMVELLKLYAAHGLELTAKELPDHLPVFLEFLSILPDQVAAALLGETAHVLEALRARLRKRGSPYARVFDALLELAEAGRDAQALAALLREPDDDPDDLAALDCAWAEEQVTFGPEKVGCPKAEAMIARMGAGG